MGEKKNRKLQDGKTEIEKKYISLDTHARAKGAGFFL
jgi:hypothetical protein